MSLGSRAAVPRRTRSSRTRRRTRSSRTPAVIVGRVGVCFLELGVGPDGLEHDVEVARHAEPCAQRGGVEPMGAEIMQDGGAVVEHRLDVDQLPGPVAFAEDPLAECEAFRPHGLGMPRAIQVFGAGRPDDALTIDGRGLVGPIQREEDLTELDPPIRLDHDGLASIQRAVAFR